MTESAASTSRPTGAVAKFVIATLVGAFFFLVPVRVGGEWTMPFDVVVGYITEGFPGAVALYSLLAILISVVLSLFGIGPQAVLAESTGEFFIAVLFISQLLFFSAVIPLLLEIDVPVKPWETVVLFLMRTAIAIPIIAVITHLIF